MHLEGLFETPNCQVFLPDFFRETASHCIIMHFPRFPRSPDPMMMYIALYNSLFSFAFPYSSKKGESRNDILATGSLSPVPGRKFHIEPEFEIKFSGFRGPGAQILENDLDD